MFLVGLTGGIGTGKSTVSAMIQEMGVPVIDADLIARQIVEPGKKAWKKIRETFGDEMFLESGELDRPKLSSLVFTDAEKRKTINKITHPEIYGEIRRQVFRYFLKGEQFVVLDLPLLFESNKVTSYLYKTITQLERLMDRNQYTEKEAISRIEAQMPLEKKCNMADIIIENSGSLSNTRKQVEGIIKLVRTSNHHIYNRVVYGGGFMAVLVAILYLLIFHVIGLL
ncbi:Dephospho-CoA kinase domain-containing protein-like [Homarus americanus]|uniref:Dephospho-CoA kinase domain-containing protein n=1 Tax=Homarus americanus TaxID=6706 RepID=A0A8J5JPL0_HOMAM|nr:Dephospho-CoA kinase domain-containing protein-like [Homarus americanus]